jgi:hypothetical protein
MFRDKITCFGIKNTQNIYSNQTSIIENRINRKIFLLGTKIKYLFLFFLDTLEELYDELIKMWIKPEEILLTALW